MADQTGLPVDANLLVALNALLEERSVTRAARRLGVTQSAASHKLKALRQQLGDELLVGGRGGLVLTPRAQEMAQPLRSALVDLAAAVRTGAEFDPATSSRKFVVATSDYGEVARLPGMLEYIAAAAPNIQVAISRLRGAALNRALEVGDVDMAAMGPTYTPPAKLRRRRMGREGFVVLVRRGHPVIGDRLTLAKYLAVGHILIAPTSAPGGPVDHVLAARGLKRRVSVTVCAFVSAPAIAANSDLVCTVPQGLAVAVAKPFALREFRPPVKLPQVTSHLYWHERAHRDPGHAWLREQIVEQAP